MEDSKNKDLPGMSESKSIKKRDEQFLEKLKSSVGTDVLNKILDYENAHELIRNASLQDFFWIIKKIGDDDCLPILSLAAEEQWQYLLDMEIWRRDRIDNIGIASWLSRLYMADNKRLVEWLFSEGQWLAFHYFSRNLKVFIREEDDDSDVTADYTTFDGVFFFKIKSSDQEELLKNILKDMSAEDHDRYKALLMGLAGILPDEIEEEMYRQKNIRLAEHGFLPREEALGVYAPLKLESLKIGGETAKLFPGSVFDEENHNIVPVMPIFHAEGENVLTKAVSGIRDPFFLDRLRLEFAGLSNQIISADGLSDMGLERLLESCRKAAGCINLVLERFCGSNTELAEKLLRNHDLISLFRGGFGMLMELKWEAREWMKRSWFYANGLGLEFWGDEWGGVLSGVLQDEPRTINIGGLGEEYRVFWNLSEFDLTKDILKSMQAMDTLIYNVAGHCSHKEDLIEKQGLTFESLIITFWARKVIGIKPAIEGLTLQEAKKFLGYLRKGEKTAPYSMSGFDKKFVDDLLDFATDIERDMTKVIRQTLYMVWDRFKDEYSWLKLKELDRRFSRIIKIEPDH